MWVVDVLLHSWFYSPQLVIFLVLKLQIKADSSPNSKAKKKSLEAPKSKAVVSLKTTGYCSYFENPTQDIVLLYPF